MQEAVSRIVPVVPAEGVEFELTLDVPPDPLEMVARNSYFSQYWRFTGTPIAPGTTRRFKLVRVGFCRNLDEVRERLRAHGRIPEGQWREAFKRAFPRHDGKGPIGFADFSWTRTTFGNHSSANIPVLTEAGTGWFSTFSYAGYVYDEWWRWLLECR